MTRVLRHRVAFRAANRGWAGRRLHFDAARRDVARTVRRASRRGARASPFWRISAGSGGSRHAVRELELGATDEAHVDAVRARCGRVAGGTTLVVVERDAARVSNETGRFTE